MEYRFRRPPKNLPHVRPRNDSATLPVRIGEWIVDAVLVPDDGLAHVPIEIMVRVPTDAWPISPEEVSKRANAVLRGPESWAAGHALVAIDSGNPAYGFWPLAIRHA